MGRTVAYPVRDTADWATLGRLSPWRRLVLALRERRYRRRAKPLAGVELIPAGAPQPLAPRDLPLVCVVRNAAGTLDAFLAHYRGLGVTRFIILDDRSEDGTVALLDRQGDVDLFRSNVDFAGSDMGLVWRDKLFDLYGRDRWYLNVDADEFLAYPGSETRPLADFIAALERAGLRRAMAPMLDLYPAGPLREAAFDAGRHAHPLAVSPMIDGDGYTLTPEKFSLAVRGGPRTRLFGNRIRLTKFPLLFVDEATRLRGGSIHGPLPIVRNFAVPHAVLLHFKFSAASVEEFRRHVSEAQHFGGGVFYREIAEAPGFGDDLDLRYPGSLRVGDSADLVARGFMADLRTHPI